MIVLAHGVPRDIYGPGLDGVAERTEAAWRKMEEGIARQSRRGRLLTVEGSGHLIAASHPERIVEAVSDLVRDSRHQSIDSLRGDPMPPRSAGRRRSA